MPFNVSTAGLAALAVVLGKPDIAMSELQELAAGRSTRVYRAWITRAVIALNPAFDSLRAHPRYQELLNSAAAPANASAAQPPADLAPAKSVVVLPFANLSGDPEQEYFSDGLTEEILNALARERDLRVPGRASAFSFKGKGASAAEIAKALNVAQLVEGSVRKSGNRVRISVQLTRASDGFSEALPTVERELTDIFALQDEVARLVVEKLTKRATTTAPVAVLTKVPEAYDAYLRGRALQTKAASLRYQAAAEYERAVTLDPNFALAWARLAETRFRDFGGQYDRSPQLIEKTRVAIDRALAANPNLPEALIMRANWLRAVRFDFAAARRDLDAAAALQPSSAEMRMAGAELARDVGDRQGGLALYREAAELDPKNGDVTNAVGVRFLMASDYPMANRLFQQATAIQGPLGVSFGNRVILRTRWRGPEAAWRLIENAPPGERDFTIRQGMGAGAARPERSSPFPARAVAVVVGEDRTYFRPLPGEHGIAAHVANRRLGRARPPAGAGNSRDCRGRDAKGKSRAAGASGHDSRRDCPRADGSRFGAAGGMAAGKRAGVECAKPSHGFHLARRNAVCAIGSGR